MEYLGYTLCILAGILVLYLVFRKRTHKGKGIPGPKGCPIIGLVLDVYPDNVHIRGYEYAQKYGEIVQINLLGRKIILLNSADIINKAFVEEDSKVYLNDRPKTYLGDTFWSSKGIVNAIDGGPGSENSQLRKLFTKGFHVYGDGIQAFEETVIKEIVNMMDKVEDNPDAEWEVVHVIERSLANLVSVLLTGEPFANADEGVRLMVDFNESLDYMYSPKADFLLFHFPWITHLPGTYKKYHQRLTQAIAKLTDTFYTKMKKTFKRGQVRGYVDFLLEEQQASAGQEDALVTDLIARSLVMEFLAAGFTTTLGTLSAIILCLLNHPDYQDKIYKEVCDVIGDRLPRLEDKSKCPVIEAVVIEALRLAPVALLGAPHTTKEDVLCAGYHIPKGSLVFPNLWFVLHDDKVWGDPWTFRPERFLDESGQLLPRSHVLRKSWIPFGVGRRQCIGETFARSRIFLYVASVFQRWKLIPSPSKCGSCDPREDQYQTRLTLHAKPFYCRAERRR